ncbi:pre-mRNA-splicing factor CWC25 [Histomonas meleagridis]|uniref:pre-mRNA-splicing factor CWC25-like n=1 Tax=Histomonas meleagridis TaxID=135588 RepID=UPI0035594B7C|nr:pre-mRNA-splicing factor CWC25 [Histomonas meleagridis]KAH0804470.1 pre-mRNA-splicing factor CWC25-like [Histomonas meleagridis]
MALKFLSKKKWHVRRIENIRKVAEAEKKYSQEQTRMAELRREREEERELENIRKIQEASGRIPKQQPRLEFLYKTPVIKRREEEEIVKTEDILAGRRPDSIMLNPDQAELRKYGIPGVKLLTEFKHLKGDEDIKTREDPLTAIIAKRKKEKEEAEALQNLLSKIPENPPPQIQKEEPRIEEKPYFSPTPQSRHRHSHHHHRHHRPSIDDY